MKALVGERSTMCLCLFNWSVKENKKIENYHVDVDDNDVGDVDVDDVDDDVGVDDDVDVDVDDDVDVMMNPSPAPLMRNVPSNFFFSFSLSCRSG